MRKLLLKTFLLAAMLLVGGSVWADPIETVGNSNLSTGYLGATSTPIVLKSGGSIHYVFTVATDKATNWDSWLLVAGGLDAPKRVVRNDNYEIVDNASSTFTSAFNWDTFKADMDGSTVDMTVTYTSGTFAMSATITTSGSTVYNYTYSGAISGSPTQIPVCLSVEKAYLQITTAEYTAPVTEPTKTVNLNFYSYVYDKGTAAGQTTSQNGHTENFTLQSNSVTTVDSKTEYICENFSDFLLYNYLAITSSSDLWMRRGSKASASSTNDGLFTQGKNQRYFSLANINKDDILNFTFVNGLTVRSSNITGIDAGGALTSATNYTVASGAQVDLLFGDGSTKTNSYIGIISITSAYDAVSNPSMEWTGLDGTSKVITITNGLSSHSNIVTTYYTTDGSTPSSSNYAGYFTASSKDVTISSNCTVKAISISTTNKQSYVVSMDVEAGSKMPMNTPTATITGMAGSAGTYYPVYTFYSDNSDLMGTPVATSYDYTFTPTTGDPTSGTLTDAKYTFTTTGTLEVTAKTTDASYGDSEAKSVTVSESFVRTQNLDVADLYDVTGLTPNNGFYSGLSYDLIADVTIGRTNDTSGAVYRGTHGSTTYNSYYARNASFNVTCSNLADDMVVVIANKDNDAYTAITSTNTSVTVAKDGTMKYYSLYAPASSTSSITVTSAGWKTLCSPYSLDFTGLDVKAYIITGGANGYVTKTQVYKVPAQTPLLLEGAGTFDVPMIDISAATDVTTGNMLVGVPNAKTIDLDSNDDEVADISIYVLMNGSNGIGFYQTTTTYFDLGANTAYLPSNFDGAAGARFFLLFGDETTGINNLNADLNLNNKVFDLQGRRVAQPTKGLYIVNGKKVVVK